MKSTGITKLLSIKKLILSISKMHTNNDKTILLHYDNDRKIIEKEER